MKMGIHFNSGAVISVSVCQCCERRKLHSIQYSMPRKRRCPSLENGMMGIASVVMHCEQLIVQIQMQSRREPIGLAVFSTQSEQVESMLHALSRQWHPMHQEPRIVKPCRL